jgi:predicted membrane channel-forming protein YqfA (hemolysin III family)
MEEVIQAVLVIVVGFLLHFAFKFLNIEIDEGTFNAIVAGIVAYIIGLLFADKVAEFLYRRGILK